METDWGVPDWFYDVHREHQFDLANKLTEEALVDFATIIGSAKTEPPCQQAIEKHAWVLLQFMRTGHGNWLFPRASFNGHFYTDFLCAEGSSAGVHWFCIELEGPQKSPFIASGAFSKDLHHAIDQVKDWRAYVEQSMSQLAARPNSVTGGKGFHNIRQGMRGYVFIGRRTRYPDRYQMRRHQLDVDDRIEVKSLDALVEGALELFYRPPYSWHNDSGPALRTKIGDLMGWPEKRQR